MSAGYLITYEHVWFHYNDVIMGAMASQITSLFLFTPFIQAQIKEDIKAPRYWPLCGEFTGDRWISRTKGQKRGKCFHLMTSSCPHCQIITKHITTQTVCMIFVYFNKIFIFTHGVYVVQRKVCPYLPLVYLMSLKSICTHISRLMPADCKKNYD